MRAIDGVLVKVGVVVATLIVLGLVLSGCDRARGTWDCLTIEHRLC